MNKYVCYYELHVGDKTFYLHTVIEGETPDHALSRMTNEGQNPCSYHLQPKGVVGLLSEVLSNPDHHAMLFEVGGGLPKPELPGPLVPKPGPTDTESLLHYELALWREVASHYRALATFAKPPPQEVFLDHYTRRVSVVKTDAAKKKHGPQNFDPFLKGMTMDMGDLTKEAHES